MDDLEDKNNCNSDSLGENRQSYPDPIEQTSGDLNMPQKKVQSVEIVQNAKMPISGADATLLPNQFVGTGGDTQTFRSVGDIIKSMLHFKWTILIVFLIITVPAIAAIWPLIVPMYRAQAELRVGCIGDAPFDIRQAISLLQEFLTPLGHKGGAHEITVRGIVRDHRFNLRAEILRIKGSVRSCA